WTPGPGDPESQWDGALTALRQYREIVPAERLPLDLHYLEGLAYLYSGQAKEAIERLQRVVAGAPEVIAAWFQYGSALMNDREWLRAIEAFEKVVASDPKHRAAIYKTYRCSLQLGDAEREAMWRERFESLGPGEKMTDREYARCGFTRIEVEAPPRADSEPPAIELHFETVALPQDGSVRDGLLAILPPEESGDGARTRPEIILLGAERAMRWALTGERFEALDARELAPWLGARRAAFADASNDGRIDAAVASAGGLRFEPAPGVVPEGSEARDGDKAREPDAGGGGEGTSDGSEATARRLTFSEAEPIAALRFVDFDHDGDLDLITLEGTGAALSPRVRRNNGDGSFALLDRSTLAGSVGGAGEEPLAFTFADLDRANDIDLIFPNAAGPAVVYWNLRENTFRRDEIVGLAHHAQVLSFDVDNDGDFDIIGLPRERDDGVVPFRIAWNDGLDAAGEKGSFRVEEIATTEPIAGVHDASLADLDNDGDLDLVLATRSGLAVLRNAKGGRFERITPRALDLRSEDAPIVACEVADVDCDGRLDIISLDRDGKVALSRQSTPEPYLSVTLALEGGRDNRSGTGAHVETLAGRGYQRIIARGPGGAFLGLGIRDVAELDGVSILWPNGIRQAILPAEIDLGKPCRRVPIVQRVGL
ncbi:MAG TPA: FG-GAP-like repeat-containing protein, partial [Planctomycetota bacterium]|nr:FG-GAP-like repeat-containing protein [Planctomycetota bacterium]